MTRNILIDYALKVVKIICTGIKSSIPISANTGSYEITKTLQKHAGCE